jgi:hypothetical protein
MLIERYENADPYMEFVIKIICAICSIWILVMVLRDRLGQYPVGLNVNMRE